MASNPTYFTDHVRDAIEAKECVDLSQRLLALNQESGSKRFAASREARRAIALELSGKAEAIAGRLSEAPARKRSPRTVKPEPTGLDCANGSTCAG